MIIEYQQIIKNRVDARAFAQIPPEVLGLVDKNSYSLLHAALHAALIYGNKEIAEMLIAKGANLNIQDEDGDVPLHIAVANGNNEIVELLLKKEADINIAGAYGLTPLHIAVAQDDKKTVALLLISKGS